MIAGPEAMVKADNGGRTVYVDLKKPYGTRAAVRKKARKIAGDMSASYEKKKWRQTRRKADGTSNSRSLNKL